MSVNIRSLLDEVDKKLEQVLNHHIEQYIQQYVSSILTQLKLLEPITLNKDVIVNELIDLTMENSTKPKDKMQDIIHIKIEMTENKKDENEICDVIRGLTGERGPVFCSGLTGEKGPVAFEEQVEEENEQVEEEDEQVEEEDEQVEEEEEEQVVEEQVVEEEQEEQVVEEEQEEQVEEEQSIETETKEEDEEEELFEIEIDDITYCTNNEESGFIWEVTDAGDIGNKVGYLKEGEPIFYKDENNKK